MGSEPQLGLIGPSSEEKRSRRREVSLHRAVRPSAAEYLGVKANGACHYS